MRKPRGPLVLLAVAVLAGVLLAAVFAASGTVDEWAAEAAVVGGLTALALVAVATVSLTWLDLLRSRTPFEYIWTAARTVLAALCAVGMWHALVGHESGDGAGAALYLTCLFGALVALALMFLFALAKTPTGSRPHSPSQQARDSGDRDRLAQIDANVAGTTVPTALENRR